MLSFGQPVRAIGLALVIAISGCGLAATYVPPTTATEANLAAETSAPVNNAPRPTYFIPTKINLPASLPALPVETSSLPRPTVAFNPSSSFSTKGLLREFRNAYFSLSYPAALKLSETTSSAGLTLQTDIVSSSFSMVDPVMDFQFIPETYTDCLQNYDDTVSYIREFNPGPTSLDLLKVVLRRGLRWYRAKEEGMGAGSVDEKTYYDIPVASGCYRFTLGMHYANSMSKNFPPSTYEEIDAEAARATDVFETIVSNFIPTDTTLPTLKFFTLSDLGTTILLAPGETIIDTADRSDQRFDIMITLTSIASSTADVDVHYSYYCSKTDSNCPESGVAMKTEHAQLSLTAAHTLADSVHTELISLTQNLVTIYLSAGTYEVSLKDTTAGFTSTSATLDNQTFIVQN